MACSLSKRSTRMARGMNPTVSGHHPPVKHRKPPVRLCPLCPADSPGPISGLRIESHIHYFENENQHCPDFFAIAPVVRGS
jgi:hypothetical protein